MDSSAIEISSGSNSSYVEIPERDPPRLSDPIGIGEDKYSERLIYHAALQDLNRPKTEDDLRPGLLSVSLMRHQKIALAWMFHKETKCLHCLGGILADDQGLGKTVSMIALILKQKLVSQEKSSSKKYAEISDLHGVDKSENANLKSKVTRKRVRTGGTLIVCPASVVKQWARELDEKVSDEAKLSVLVYHGGNRTKDPVELAMYDVVVTTYAIVANEFPKQLSDEKDTDKLGLSLCSSNNKKRKKGVDYDSGWGTLARVRWLRVVLDEAQTIKNHKTQMARACCSLRANRRWCLSGTPIQNTIDDLFSYFRFLRYDPYAEYKSFCITIKVPIYKNSRYGYKKLQAVLSAVMLRRTKETFLDGKPIIDLPPKIVNSRKVEFSSEEQSFYKKLEADARSQFKLYADAGTVNQNYGNILLMILRLRQACVHPRLVKAYNLAPVGKVSGGEAINGLRREARLNLLIRLESSSSFCCACRDPPEDPVVTLCGHVFCCECISQYITEDKNTCPSPRCREEVAQDAVFSESALRNCITDDLGCGSSQDVRLKSSVFRSSKIKAILDILQSLSDPSSPSHGPIKTIIFSQWTSMLDLVEPCFVENCINFRRLDGTMSLGARDKAVEEFSNDPNVTVMLISLKSGNIGLNMVAACHVILLDPWWNPAAEDQAIDRAHRIGQTRPVTVTRITIKDTIEDRILSYQEDKRRVAASAFGEDTGGCSSTRLTIDDLKYLFMV